MDGTLTEALAPAKFGAALLEQTFDTPGAAGPRRIVAASIATSPGATAELGGGFCLSLYGAVQTDAFGSGGSLLASTARQASHARRPSEHRPAGSPALRTHAGLG